MDSFQYLSFTAGGRFWYMSSTESRDTWPWQKQGTGVALQGHEQDQWLQMLLPAPTWQGEGCHLQGAGEAPGLSPGCIWGFPLLNVFLGGEGLSSGARLLSVPWGVADPAVGSRHTEGQGWRDKVQPCFLAWEYILDKDLHGQEQGWGPAGHRSHCQGAGMSLCPNGSSPTQCQPGAGPTCKFLSISLLVSKSSSSSPKGLMICSATWGGRGPGETREQGQGHLPTGLSIPWSTYVAHEMCRPGALWCPGVMAGPNGHVPRGS